MRDYLIVGLVLASLPVGLIQPYYGMLFYCWISYMSPHMLTWSFASTLPVAKLSGIAMLAGTILQRYGDTRPLRQRENLCMIALFAVFTFSSIFAIYPDRAWMQWQEVAKKILIALVTSMMLIDRKRLWFFFLVIAFSIGFYGIKGGVFSLLTGGREMVLGPIGPAGAGASMMGANNAIGLALNMCLPMFWYLPKNTSNAWFKRLCFLSFFLTIPAIMFTYARASALAVGVVIFCLILKGKKKLLGIGLLLAVGIVAVNFLPDRWVNRQQSTLEYEQDSSAMSRFGEWEFALRVAFDRPLTGGGFNFQSWEIFAKYSPEFLTTYNKIWDTHSIYFGILSDHGFPGLIVFLLMLGFSLQSLSSIKRAVRDRPDLQWLTTYADMLQLSFLGFLVNGAFVNMEYFDLVYQWVGVIASLKVLTQQELSGSPTPSPQATTINGSRSKRPHVRSSQESGVAPVRTLRTLTA